MRRVLLHVALLLLLLASVGVPAIDTATQWQATSYAGWPGLGLSAVLFATAGHRGRPWSMLAQSGGLGIVLSVTYDVRWWQGVAASLAVTVPALLSLHWLRPGTAARRRFVEGEVDAYHGVTAAVGVACGLLSATAAALAGRDEPAQVALTGLIACFAATTAQLVLLPFHLRRPGRWSLTTTSVEMWGQRVVLVLALAAVFLPQTMLPVTFVLFPVLGWVAIRGSATETHQQVLLVSVVAFAATLAGRGPLALRSLTSHTEFAPLLVYLFIASICYLLVPLALTVERLRDVTRSAVRSESTVRRMLDSASGTVFIATDPAGVITHCNQGTETALGVPADQLVGRLTYTLHTPREIDRQACALGVDDTAGGPRARYDAAALAQVRRGVRRDWEFIRGDGEARIVSLNISRMSSPDDATTGFIASGEDVTERARAQAALEQAYERERSSVAALREADEMKRKLVAVVSHEFRTPITSISGFTEALREGSFGDLTTRQTAVVGRIERNSVRLRQLVEDLLSFSDPEALATEREDVDLNDVVRGARERVMFQADGRRLQTRVSLDPRPVIVRGDRLQLERAVVHLWTNAVKFTPDGGAVTVSTMGPQPTDSPEGVALGQVVVADTGMGITHAEQSRVFARFYRTAAAEELAIQGSGLGLGIVESIVRQHEGTVDLRSVPDVGTVVTLSIPA